MSLPTDSSHLSSLPSAQLIEEFNGNVESQFEYESMMRKYCPFKIIRNGDTAINRRIGKSTLQKVTAGVRPNATARTHGRAAVTVDTIILARDNQDLLNDFQSDFQVRADIAEDHGTEIAKFFDQAILIQAIKGALANAPTDVDSIGAGKDVTLAAANDELDPDKLYEGIVEILVAMEDEDINLSKHVVIVRPKQYEVLLNNSKLTDADLSPNNADVAKGAIKCIYCVPIVKSARIPTQAITDHKLSNDNNSNAYDVSATEAKAVAVIVSPRALLAAETIPLMSKVHYSDMELQYFIDSLLSFGVAVSRPDLCGALFKA